MKRFLLVVAIVLATAQPVAVAAAPGTTRHTYSDATGTLDYLLFLPDRAGPVPLLVYLHGCGAPDGLPALDTLAGARGLAVAYPLQSVAANPSRCWNWTRDQDRHRDAGEPSLIAGITREVTREHAVDPARVFVAGHSAGSGMTAILAAAYPDLYTAAALIAGCGNLTCADVTGLTPYLEMGPRARAVPAYIAWGRNDTVNPYWTGRLQLQQWLAMNDLADDRLLNLSVPRLPSSTTNVPAAGGTPAYTVERFRDRRGCAAVDFVSVTGAGHVPDFAWQPVLPGALDFLLGQRRC